MNHPTNKTIIATVGSVMAVSALQASGIPVLEGLAIGAGCAVIAIAVKRQFKQQDAPTVPTVPELPPDEDIRHEILRREKALDIRLNASYRNISRFVSTAMNHAMNREGTTDHSRLYEVANRVYTDLNPPFVLAHDAIQVAVIQWCIRNKCVPSPLPKEWAEYAAILAQIGQDMGDTNAPNDVLPDVQTHVDGVSEVASSVSNNVTSDVCTLVSTSNVIQLPAKLPLLAAMSDLKAKLGDKAKPAYSLYGAWCSDLTDELLRVRAGREWAKAHDSSLTISQTDALLRVFKLRAVKDGLLVQNPEYKGKPPFPEYLITSQTTANAATASTGE